MKLKVAIALLLSLNNFIVLPAEKNNATSQDGNSSDRIMILFSSINTTETKIDLQAIVWGTIKGLSKNLNKEDEYDKKTRDFFEQFKQNKTGLIAQLNDTDDEQEKLRIGNSIEQTEAQFTKDLLNVLMGMETEYPDKNDYFNNLEERLTRAITASSVRKGGCTIS